MEIYRKNLGNTRKIFWKSKKKKNKTSASDTPPEPRND